MIHATAERFTGRALLHTQDPYAPNAVRDVLVDVELAIDRTGALWTWGGTIRGRSTHIARLLGRILVVELDAKVQGHDDDQVRACSHALLTSVEFESAEGAREIVFGAYLDRGVEIPTGRATAQLAGIGAAPFDALGAWPVASQPCSAQRIEDAA